MTTYSFQPIRQPDPYEDLRRGSAQASVSFNDGFSALKELIAAQQAQGKLNYQTGIQGNNTAIQSNIQKLNSLADLNNVDTSVEALEAQYGKQYTPGVVEEFKNQHKSKLLKSASAIASAEATAAADKSFDTRVGNRVFYDSMIKQGAGMEDAMSAANGWTKANSVLSAGYDKTKDDNTLAVENEILAKGIKMDTNESILNTITNMSKPYDRIGGINTADLIKKFGGVLDGRDEDTERSHKNINWKNNQEDRLLSKERERYNFGRTVTANNIADKEREGADAINTRLGSVYDRIKAEGTENAARIIQEVGNGLSPEDSIKFQLKANGVINEATKVDNESTLDLAYKKGKGNQLIKQQLLPYDAEIIKHQDTLNNLPPINNDVAHKMFSTDKDGNTDIETILSVITRHQGERLFNSSSDEIVNLYSGLKGEFGDVTASGMIARAYANSMEEGVLGRKIDMTKVTENITAEVNNLKERRQTEKLLQGAKTARAIAESEGELKLGQYMEDARNALWMIGKEKPAGSPADMSEKQTKTLSDKLNSEIAQIDKDKKEGINTPVIEEVDSESLYVKPSANTTETDTTGESALKDILNRTGMQTMTPEEQAEADKTKNKMKLEEERSKATTQKEKFFKNILEEEVLSGSIYKQPAYSGSSPLTSIYTSFGNSQTGTSKRFGEDDIATALRNAGIYEGDLPARRYISKVLQKRYPGKTVPEILKLINKDGEIDLKGK